MSTLNININTPSVNMRNEIIVNAKITTSMLIALWVINVVWSLTHIESPFYSKFGWRYE